MGPIPSELVPWLPSEVRAADVDAWAFVGRTFDRVHGEALVVRMRAGELHLLTRAELDVPFRALPLAERDALGIVEGRELRLHARMVDGRLLTMPLTRPEGDAIRAALSIEPTRSASAPPRSASVPPVRAASVPPVLSASVPPARRASLRPPESASSEVVRLPRSGAPPRSRPASMAPARPPSRPPPRPESLRPLLDAPAPVVRSAEDTRTLRARFRHHWDHGQLDEAIEVARALVHLGIADPIERRLASQPGGPPTIRTPLTPPLFRAFLAHDDEDADLGRLLAAIVPAYLATRTKPEAELGLRLNDEVDLATTQHPFARLFGQSARDLGIPGARLFLRTDVPGGMAYLPTAPIASLCGATLATGFDAPSTRHVLGYHLAFYRPEALLFALAPGLSDVYALVVAVAWLQGKLEGEHARLVDARIGALAETLARQMTAADRAAIRAACDALAIPEDAKAGLGEALRRQRRVVHLAAVRSGLLLSGSLASSDRMQRIMPAVPGVALEELLDDLVTFSVSPAWMALRKELGIARDAAAEAP